MSFGFGRHTSEKIPSVSIRKQPDRGWISCTLNTLYPWPAMRAASASNEGRSRYSRVTTVGMFAIVEPR